MTDQLTDALMSLCWMAFTVLIFLLFLAIQKRIAWLNAVLLSIITIIVLLTMTDVTYQTYFDHNIIIHWLLGPATVALAIPLYRQLSVIRQHSRHILIAMTAGSLTAVLSALSIAGVMGMSDAALISLAPKSVTTPIAMIISESIGGLPPLTAIYVIITGVYGAVICPLIFKLFSIHSSEAKGLALGISSHGVGTAKSVELGEVAAAWSALAMGLNGLFTAILLPILM